MPKYHLLSSMDAQAQGQNTSVPLGHQYTRESRTRKRDTKIMSIVAGDGGLKVGRVV